MKVIYPGSFDPVTLGHIDIIRRLSKQFSKVYVVVMDNPAKSTWFTALERAELLRKSLKSTAHVNVDSFKGLLVNYARRIKVSVVVRGLRAISDYDAEFKMSLANKDIYPGMETLFMITDKRHAFLSSSLVKEIALYGGSVRKFVPAPVAAALKHKAKQMKNSEARIG